MSTFEIMMTTIYISSSVEGQGPGIKQENDPELFLL
jgi:hypothetical protein